MARRREGRPSAERKLVGTLAREEAGKVELVTDYKRICCPEKHGWIGTPHCKAL